MPMVATVADTPYYVLMDVDRRIGPKVMPLRAGIECSTIYGFSDKGRYNTFCANSQLTFTPYPLVTGYLRNQANEPGNGLKLVVMDAAGPLEPSLHAATMEAVLEAQEQRTAHVTAAYQLMFDQQAAAYRVEEPDE